MGWAFKQRSQRRIALTAHSPPGQRCSRRTGFVQEMPACRNGAGSRTQFIPDAVGPGCVHEPLLRNPLCQIAAPQPAVGACCISVGLGLTRPGVPRIGES